MVFLLSNSCKRHQEDLIFSYGQQLQRLLRLMQNLCLLRILMLTFSSDGCVWSVPSVKDLCKQYERLKSVALQ